MKELWQVALFGDATASSAPAAFFPRHDTLVSCMTIEEIRELIQLVTDTGVAELEVQRGENRVRIRRSFGAEEAKLYEISAPAPAAAPAAPALVKSETPTPASDPQLVYTKSPIVGTF